MRNQRAVDKITILLLAISFSMCITPHSPKSYAQQLPQQYGDGTLRRLRTPILMYHYVDHLPPDADEIRTNLTLDPTIFDQHLDYLKTQDYTTISLYEIHLALLYGTPIPQRPVVLTFDDGYIDHYTTVFPALKEHNFTGTFFVVSEFADENRPGYMSWNQIAEMARAGMSIEAHTKSHADLRNRDTEFLIYQIVGSIESIQHHTGIEPRLFAYPVGHYDQNTLMILDTTRILRAVTTESGVFHTSTNPLLMSRMRITNRTGVPGLVTLLNYDK